MDLRKVLNLMAVLCWVSCVYGNQGVPKSYFIAANSGENSVANEYKVMHGFNFPDVTYPTSLLDTCTPFYFNSISNGLDSIVGPFPSDVKSNYISLLSCDNENKVKDEVSLTTNKCDLKDDIVTCAPKNKENAFKKNESEGTNKLENIRTSLRNFLQKNNIDPELEDILSLLYSDEAEKSDDLNVDNYLINNNNYEIEPKLNVPDIEEMMLQPLIVSRIYLDSSDSSMDEKEPEPINNDKYNQFNLNNSTIDNNVDTLIINDDNIYENLHNKSFADVNTPEPMIENVDDDALSKLNNSYTTEIKLDVEKINGDMCYLVNTNNSDNYELEMDIIKKYCNFNKTIVDEQLSNPIIIDNPVYLNNSNLDDNISQPIVSNLDSHNNEQNINVSLYEDNNQLVKLSNAGDSSNESELTNIGECTLSIPKEAVVFDVVSKDGFNLEKPVLDIVPSNIPVRLKINIEICKSDSIEKDDLTEIDNDLQILNPFENNIDSRDINNSIENIDESDLIAHEQITELDEINDSDFISALSILLLDSLNNKPIEIMSPETINTECNNKPFEYPINDDENFINNSTSTPVNQGKTPTVPDFIYSYNNLNGETKNGHINPSEVKFINTSPLFDTLSPIINTNHIQEAVDTDNISEVSHTINFKEDSQKKEEPGKIELLTTYPLIYYPYNVPGFPLNMVE